MRRAPWLALLLIACDGGGATDAGPGGDAGSSDPDGGPPPISALVETTAPRFVCPSGWSERTLQSGPTVCDPFPAGRLDCAVDEWQPLGSAACVRIGPECPAGDFADDEPATGIVYVRAGATGGDGTRAAPYGTVREAVDGAADGETVLVAAGAYMGEVLVLRRPVRIRGTCLGAVFGSGSSISVRSPGVVVENLRFEGAARGIVGWSGDFVARSLAVRDVGGPGIASFGADAVVEDVSIRDAREEGLRWSRGEVTARGVEVRNAGLSVFLCDLGATCRLEDVVLELAEGSDEIDTLVGVGADSEVSIERAYIASDALHQIQCSETMSMTDVVIQGPGPVGVVDSPAIFVVGGQLTLTRAWIREQLTSGPLLGEGGQLIAEDLVLTDTHPNTRGGGYGMFVNAGSSATLTNAWIERASSAGLVVSGTGARVDATNLTVLGSVPASDGYLGRGIQVQLGAHLEADRVRVEDVYESGLIVSQGATASVRDLRVRAVVERACTSAGCPPAGNGVASYLDGALSLERFAISNVALAGLQLAENGAIDAADGEVFDNPVGINLQTEGYDLSRLMDRVLYYGNGVNLDATSFEIPDPTPPPIVGP